MPCDYKKYPEDGKKVTIENDMGFGTGTITINNEHSHFGDFDKEKGLANFIDGLHSLLVEEKGLSWHRVIRLLV